MAVIAAERSICPPPPPVRMVSMGESAACPVALLVLETVQIEYGSKIGDTNPYPFFAVTVCTGSVVFCPLNSPV